jgi:hypothetical protein
MAFHLIVKKNHVENVSGAGAVLGMAFHLIVKKNHVENVSGVLNGTCHERKGHRRKYMDRQTTLGGAENVSDIHHRETDKKCKKLCGRLLLTQLDGRSCPHVKSIAINEKLLPLRVRLMPPFDVQCRR